MYCNLCGKPCGFVLFGCFTAVSADGFHSDGNNFGPRLRDSEISYTGDDLGNICSAMSVLLSLNGTAEALMMDATTTNLVRGKRSDVISFYNISSVDWTADFCFRIFWGRAGKWPCSSLPTQHRSIVARDPCATW